MDKFFDVLIVGSGVSGLYCALNLREDLKVLLISKSKLKNTNTYLAQGGISVARDNADIELFVQDTLKAGKYKNNETAVRVMARESRNDINSLIELGVNFDQDEQGINYTREGAHRVNRIVHVKDSTGASVAEALIQRVKERKNIEILEHTVLVDIIEADKICVGAVVGKANKKINIHSKVVVLATGGIGGLFKNSTNERTLTGDGIAVAINHGVKVQDLNYLQIHPTAFYDNNIYERRLLISESLRGEGAILTNSSGEKFVDPLLPRDVVTKAINKEISKSGIPYVNLDISFLDSDYLKNRFSFIYEECLKRGTDITKDTIKVSPAHHYFMGGIKVDLDSKTSMYNLYAVGETSCTGVHGANRLASNSLLEGLVFSRRAAKSINKSIGEISINKFKFNNVVKDVNVVSKSNREKVITAIKNQSGDMYDELFNYR